MVWHELVRSSLCHVYHPDSVFSVLLSSSFLGLGRRPQTHWRLVWGMLPGEFVDCVLAEGNHCWTMCPSFLRLSTLFGR